MGDELICPDCGGVIGATEVTDAGRPCTCFAYLQKVKPVLPAAAQVADAIAEEGRPTDEVAIDALNENAEIPNLEDPSNLTGSAKICIKCGADVAGKKRLKDSRGYLCYDCAKEERRAERGGRVRCASCSRWAAESAIIEYEGLKICDRCHRDRLEAQRKSFKRFGITHNQKRHQKKEVITLIVIIAALLLLATLRQLGILPPLWK